jgi:hypothetical protein
VDGTCDALDLVAEGHTGGTDSHALGESRERKQGSEKSEKRRTIDSLSHPHQAAHSGIRLWQDRGPAREQMGEQTLYAKTFLKKRSKELDAAEYSSICF